MEKVTAWCHFCKKMVQPENVHLVKWRNTKTKSGSVEAWEGTCADCQKRVYKIKGH